jgi:hypothetical protein
VVEKFEREREREGDVTEKRGFQSGGGDIFHEEGTPTSLSSGAGAPAIGIE